MPLIIWTKWIPGVDLYTTTLDTFPNYTSYWNQLVSWYTRSRSLRVLGQTFIISLWLEWCLYLPRTALGMSIVIIRDTELYSRRLAYNPRCVFNRRARNKDSVFYTDVPASVWCSFNVWCGAKYIQYSYIRGFYNLYHLWYIVCVFFLFRLLLLW